MLQTFIRHKIHRRMNINTIKKMRKNKENCVNNSLVLFGYYLMFVGTSFGLAQTNKETVYYSSSDF